MTSQQETGYRKNVRTKAAAWNSFYTQGHPTTECFKIRQKCLRPVWSIWSCPKEYFFVQINQERFSWFFRLIRKC